MLEWKSREIIMSEVQSGEVGEGEKVLGEGL